MCNVLKVLLIYQDSSKTLSISCVSQKDQLGKIDRPSSCHGASSDKPAHLFREHSGEQQEEKAQACWWEGTSARTL